MIDDQTPNLGLPLPSPTNLLSEDVERIRTTFVKIDEAIFDQTQKNQQFADNLTQTLTQANEQFEQNITQSLAEQSQEINDQLAKIKILALAGL